MAGFAASRHRRRSDPAVFGLRLSLNLKQQKPSSMSANSHHDRMVASLVDYMRNLGMTIIGIDLPGENKPSPVGDSLPDVEARNSLGDPVYGEVEDCGMVSSSHTLHQLEDFLGGGDSFVYLSVPKECLDEASQVVSRKLAGRNVKVISTEENTFSPSHQRP